MLSTDKMAKAAEYNKSAWGRLWMITDLPWPYCDHIPTTSFFTHAVALFQSLHGLVVDGKLGPATLSTMRAVMAQPAPEDKADSLPDGYSPPESPPPPPTRYSDRTARPSCSSS